MNLPYDPLKFLDQSIELKYFVAFECKVCWRNRLKISEAFFELLSVRGIKNFLHHTTMLSLMNWMGISYFRDNSG